MTTGRLADAVTVARLLEYLERALAAHGVSEPVAEAREIVAALYDVPRFWPLINGTLAVDADTIERARLAVERRGRGAPLAYAVGRSAFRNLTLDVDDRVLIPRPETEHLVDLVLDELTGTTPGIAVDVGTGSGAIALALASEGSFSRVYATDISRDALDVARRNAERARSTLRAPIELRHGSLLGPLLGVQAHVVVSNPPYIATGEATSLPSSVRDWEPPVALFSGADGMTATARLVRQAADVLAPGGVLAIEVDVRRASLAAELVARERCFDTVRVELDFTGRERFVLARRQVGGN